jgi:uncharacterized membrane protein
VVIVANLVYALHTFAIVAGVIGTATVVGSFVGSIPSILAVILNYVKRSDARGTWAESHYRWQIRTFWFTLLWIVVAVALLPTIVFIPIAIGIAVTISVWVIYRIGKGWLRLRDHKPMYE